METTRKIFPFLLGCLLFAFLSPSHVRASPDGLNTVDQLIEDYLWWLPAEMDEEIAQAEDYIDHYWEAQERQPEAIRLDIDEGTFASDFPRIADLDWEDYLAWLEDRSVIDESNEAYTSVKTLLSELDWPDDPMGLFNDSSEDDHKDLNSEQIADWQKAQLSAPTVTGQIKSQIVYNRNTLEGRIASDRAARTANLAGRVWQRDLGVVNPLVGMATHSPQRLAYNDCGAFRWGVDVSLDNVPILGLIVSTVTMDYRIKDANNNVLFHPSWKLPFLETRPRKAFQFYVFDYLEAAKNAPNSNIYSINMNFIDYPFGFDATSGFIRVDVTTRVFDFIHNLNYQFVDNQGRLLRDIQVVDNQGRVIRRRVDLLSPFQAMQYDRNNPDHQRFRRFHGFDHGTLKLHPRWKQGGRPVHGFIFSKWDCTQIPSILWRRLDTDPIVQPRNADYSNTRWLLYRNGGQSYRGFLWRGRETPTVGVASPLLP